MPTVAPQGGEVVPATVAVQVPVLRGGTIRSMDRLHSNFRMSPFQRPKRHWLNTTRYFSISMLLFATCMWPLLLPLLATMKRSPLFCVMIPQAVSCAEPQARLLWWCHWLLLTCKENKIRLI